MGGRAKRSHVIEPLVDLAEFPASRHSTYLNTASVNLMYRGAESATVGWFRDLAERGTIDFDEVAEETVFSELHDAGARLFDVRPADIAVGSSATELLASLAWSVAPASGRNIVGADIVFPSTMYPWARVARHTGAEIRWASADETYVDPGALIRLIDADTAVVCISDVEYSTGQRYDVGLIAEACQAHGAMLVVDATQSAGAIQFHPATWDVDAVVTASYKWLCGPFGAAVMYLAPHWHEVLDPGFVGFRSHRSMWDLRADRLELPDDASRFEASTMAYGCAVGMAASIDYLLGIGIDRIATYNMSLADELVAGLQKRDAEIVSPLERSQRTSIVAARFPGIDPVAVAQGLNDARVIVSQRRDLVRFSPHLYNTSDDIARALDAIDALS
jgi:selenocysteine lyase/cysteine desulfurase